MPREISEASADPATQGVETAEELKASSAVLEETAETVENVCEAGAENVRGVPAAIRDGASDARRAAAGILPAMGAMIRKGVYSGFY